MTTRINNWNSVLSELARQRMHTPFVWGQNDCITFAADCVQALTGVDHLGGYRGAYTSEAGADELIASRLNGSLANAALEVLGEEVEPRFAQPGDVVLGTANGKEMFGVCFGDIFMAPGPAGLVSQPMTSALRAWRCAREEDA